MHAIFRHTLICAIHYLHAFVGLWACVEEFGSVHTHTDMQIIHMYMCVNKHVCPKQVVSAYVLRDLTKAAENVVGRVGRAYLRVPSRVRQDYVASCRQDNSAKIYLSMCENMRKRVEQTHRSQLSAEPALPFLNPTTLGEQYNSSLECFFPNEFCEPRGTGAHLAQCAAKNTEYVHATVLPSCFPSSKYFSPLATVRSLELFSTVGGGCISLLAEVEPRPLHPAEATALVGPLPRGKRSF